MASPWPGLAKARGSIRRTRPPASPHNTSHTRLSPQHLSRNTSHGVAPRSRSPPKYEDASSQLPLHKKLRVRQVIPQYDGSADDPAEGINGSGHPPSPEQQQEGPGAVKASSEQKQQQQQQHGVDAGLRADHPEDMQVDEPAEKQADDAAAANGVDGMEKMELDAASSPTQQQQQEEKQPPQAVPYTKSSLAADLRARRPRPNRLGRAEFCTLTPDQNAAIIMR